jgi:hypothetical protein
MTPPKSLIFKGQINGEAVTLEPDAAVGPE